MKTISRPPSPVQAEIHEPTTAPVPQTAKPSDSAAGGSRFEAEAGALAELKPRRSTESLPASTPRARTASLPGAGERRLSTATTLSASSASSQSSERSARSATSGTPAASDNEVAFQMPPPCGGSLTQVGGRLVCEQDHGVQSVLDLVSQLDPELVRDLEIPAGATIEIAWDEQLPEKMREFMKLAGGNPILATDLLRDAIDRGAAAFTPQATMSDSSRHPGDFLRQIGIRIVVTPNAALGDRMQAALTPAAQGADSPERAARLDKFRNDFGAMSLLSLANHKEFNSGHLYGLGASIGGTGTLGATFDYGVWSRVKAGMSEETRKVAGPLVDALTPLLADTFDSMVVKRLAEVLKGKNFFPDNLGDTVSDLKGAAFSGLVTAIGSIANNYVRELAVAARQAGHSELAVGLLVAKQFTNLLATWTAGAMVPLEVMHEHRALVDSKLHLMARGLIPTPDVADVRKHVSELAMNTVRAARGPGTLVRSMATGGEIAATIGLVLSLLEHNGYISSSLDQLITLLYSTPTEVISMTSAMAAEKWSGDGGEKKDARRTNDAGKQSGMLSKIAESGNTTLADLDRIARPDGDRNAAFGYHVTQGLGSVINVVDKGAGLGRELAGKGLAPVGAMLVATAATLETVPYVTPVLTTLGRGAADGAQFVFDHAVKPVGTGVRQLGGAAYEHVLKPTGQGVAWTAGKMAPLAAPVGRGAAAVATATGKHVVLPLANATAATVDTSVRAVETALSAGVKATGAVVDAGAAAGDWAAKSGADAIGRAARALRQPRPAPTPSGEDIV